MNKSSIANNILQELLDSAANAADKGQAQWFTPPDWAKVLSIPLCQYRPHVVDLACGNGQLLAGAKRRGKHTLGCDIDSGWGEAPSIPNFNFVTADVTKLYPLLRAVGWKADVFALNPPWDMHWWRTSPLAMHRTTNTEEDGDGRSGSDRLRTLAESDCPAVDDAFTEHDGRTTRDTIDSTVATLCMALDRMSHQGEG